MKALTGREASVLAILAQSRALSVQDKERILSTLEGSALKIAKVIVGWARNPSKAHKTAAKGFLDWADKLPEALQ